MRFGVSLILCAVLAGGSFGAGLAAAGGQSDFSIAVPDGWTESAALEKAAVDGFHKGDPDDPIQAFAWSNPKSNIILLVQSTTSAGQLDQGTFRTNLVAMHKAIPKSMGLTGAHASVSDDGHVMTGNLEGDLGTAHVLMTNEGMIDSGRHLRAYSVMCMMLSPVSDSARADCHALLSSFKVTLDPSTFLPLEPQSK